MFCAKHRIFDFRRSLSGWQLIGTGNKKAMAEDSVQYLSHLKHLGLVLSFHLGILQLGDSPTSPSYLRIRNKNLR